MDSSTHRLPLAYFLLGFSPLLWLDGWNVFADTRSGTAVATLLLLLVAAVLGCALLRLKPLNYLLPSRLRGLPVAAFALGLSLALCAQLPTWLPYADLPKLARRLLDVPVLFLLTLLLAYPVLVRLMAWFPLPKRPGMWLAIIVISNMGYFHWLDGKSQQELTRTIRLPLGEESAEAEPNVILLVFDTMRADTLHHQWKGQAHTPWLDAYTADARVFERGYSAANTTPGGHSALLTGRYPAENGTLAKGEVILPLSEVTLAEHLRGYGYRTVAAVTNARITRANGFGQGFEIYDDSLVLNDSVMHAALNRFGTSSLLRLLGGKKVKRGVTAVSKRLFRSSQLELNAADTTARVLASVDALEAQAGEPVFLFVNYIDPHFPYETRSDLAASFGPNYQNAEMDQIRNNSLQMHEMLRHAADDIRNGIISEEIQNRLEWLQEAYREQYLELDEGVKALFEGLEERGIMNENTLVLITSDHGEHLGAHGIMMHGRSLFEDEVHVPFLLMGPRVKAGTVSDPVSGVDFFATVLHAMGMTSDDAPGMMGVPLQEEIPIRVVRFESGRQRGFVVGNRKMIADDSGSELTWIEAYDLGEDPEEAVNLIDAGLPWVEAFKENPPIQPDSGASQIIAGSGQVDLAALGYADEG
ncbi:MAG: sulfatase [Planctomycetota bacterium]